MHSSIRLECHSLAFYGPQGGDRNWPEGEPSFRLANELTATRTVAFGLLSFSYCHELYVQCFYLDLSFVFLVLGEQDVPIPLKSSCRKGCHTVLTEYSSLLNQAGALAN